MAGAQATGSSGTSGTLAPIANPTQTLQPLPAPAPTAMAGDASTGMRLPSTREPVSIDQCGATNPAGVTGADLAALLAGSGGPGTLRWLYPYEGTVFPRGMLAPMLMWDGGPADAVYVHIKSQFFEYKGCLKPSADGQLVLPQDVWERAGLQSFGKADPYTIQLTTLRAGAATGPIARVIVIAQANIKGSIYYNSYSSRLGSGIVGPGGLPGPGGALPGPGLPLPGLGAGGTVLRIPQGKIAEPFLNTGCNGCHAVSANGSRLISQFAPGSGQSYELNMTTSANPPARMAGPRAAWGALYPDGSRFLATSAQIDIARTFMTQGLLAPPEATLYDTATGQVVSNTGIPAGALMPMFSPDGTMLAFNDNALANAHGLALMKFDVASNTASEPRTLMMTSGSMRPGWPFFLPDNGAVVFVQTDGADFSGNGAGLAGAIGAFAAPLSDLYLADITSGTVTLLAQAMGFDKPEQAAGDQTYLPFGASELHHNYFPTVSPVAAGGYFWVFFDSARQYGNFGMQRALWASAIEIQPDGKYSADASRPAFYVPGQEFNTGNHRAFAALDPCKPDGGSCLSGIDCCGGRCYLPEPTEFAQAPGMCSPPPKNECAKTDERCTLSSDCCPPEPGKPMNSCIAGFCAVIMLQ